jgi:DNA processing protein
MVDPVPTRIDACRPEELLGPLNDVERKFAPKQIWFDGHRDRLASDPRVAVVGSRKLSEAGERRTQDVARFLVEKGIVVVSGLAAGADTIAHQTAISARGRTIAVLGTPIQTCYPASNRELQRRIGREHLLLSQFAPGSAIQRGNFVIRNRLMALVADASIIVEAGDSSGTLSQGWEALRLGRQLFILDPVVKDPKLEWPAKMIEYGAVPLALDGFAEILEALPPPGARLHADHSA